MILHIPQKSKEPTINIALDTIVKGKQALIFVGTKRSAEKQAEEISKKIKENKKEWLDMSEEVLNALSRPTTQCERLSRTLQKGIAFHHAGLASKQKELIEDKFRDGTINVICCTPTLAMGLDLPAFRAVVKDVKRFGKQGTNWITVLEYMQMSGRAGRPGKEEYGEAIMIAEINSEKDELIERFVHGEPEEIFSKLAVEPVLRTYVLSLVSSGFARTKEQLLTFFSKTFWAHHYKDMPELEKIINKMIYLLQEYEFIYAGEKGASEFKSASQIMDEKLTPTVVGKRVSELYIDPSTANHFIKCLTKKKEQTPIALLHMLAHTGEIRPLLRVKTSEYDEINESLAKDAEQLFENEPSVYEDEHEEFINAYKTAIMLHEWTDEKDEEYLLEKYSIRPGELKAKLDVADWLIYSAGEISKLKGIKTTELAKLRIRLKNGVKEELLPLLRLKGIGRVRARMMFNNKIKDIGDVKKADMSMLTLLLKSGKIAQNVKEQVGQKVEITQEQKREEKKKGQQKLRDY